MKITLKWLEENNACSDGKDWFIAQKEKDGIAVVKKLMAEKHNEWSNWLIVRIMERPQYLAYAIFAAEQVIDIYEEKYPSDKRPRNAIEVAKKCLADDSYENRETASTCGGAAYASASAAAVTAYASASAAASAYAARAAAYAARAVVVVGADCAYTCASYATYACAAYATDGEKMQVKILTYGLQLLEKVK